MGESEFRNDVGLASKRMPSLRQLNVTNEEGKPETVYVFSDHAHKYRTLTLEASVGVQGTLPPNKQPRTFTRVKVTRTPRDR